MKKNRDVGRVMALISALTVVWGTALAMAGPAGAAVSAGAAQAPASPAVKVCGAGGALTRPASMILTCADDGELAEHLQWSSWTASQAVASGIVTWREYSAVSAANRTWGKAKANVVLTDPVRVPGSGVLFTKLKLQVTGPTPEGFMRKLTFDEAPLPPAPVSSVPPRPAAASPSASPAASSGTLSYADIEGFWIDAGGSSAPAGTYNNAQIAAAIADAESSSEPGVIQQDQPYSTTGWGLWQMTPGNELPEDYGMSQYGTDYQLLDPWNNAESAVYLYDARGFEPWSTYTLGTYASHLQSTAANTNLTDPGEYVQIGSAPAGTPSSPAADPGGTFGPPMPGTSDPGVAVNSSDNNQFVFFRGGNGDIYQADFDGSSWSNTDMCTSQNWGCDATTDPGVAANSSNNNQYVFFRGGNSHIYEALYNGSSWSNTDMCANHNWGCDAASAPGVAVDSADNNQFVFFTGGNGHIYEALYNGSSWSNTDMCANHNWGCDATSVTGVAVNSSDNNQYVFFRGGNGDIYEAFYGGSSWSNTDMCASQSWGCDPTSAPGVAVNPTDDNQFVFFRGGNGHIYEAYYGGSSWSNTDMCASQDWGCDASSGPGVGVDSSDNHQFVFFRGGNGHIYEAFYNGSSWSNSDMCATHSWGCDG